MSKDVRQIIADALAKVELPDYDPSKLSTLQRMVLGGKHPVEKMLEMIQTLPDEVLPSIVDVARAIVESAGDS